MRFKSRDEKELREDIKKHAEESGIKVNPDKKIVDNLVKGLFMKKKKFGEMYCPCRVVTGDKEKDKDIICPCVFHIKEVEKDGHCLCGLFVNS